MEGVCLSVLLEAEGFIINPPQDARVCINRWGVSSDSVGSNLVPSSISFLVNLCQDFFREVSNNFIENRSLCGHHILIILICDYKVGLSIIFGD
jgi:hypothetical protein